MTKYLVRRILISIPIFFGVTMLVYSMYALAPGDPVVSIIGIEALAEMTPEQIDSVRVAYGLDQPIHIRYARWFSAAARGDLGYPLKGQGTVVENLKQRLPPTLLLMGTAFLLALMISIPMGIAMALKQYSWLDYSMTVVAFVNLSIPVFFLALGSIYVFSLKLDILPTYGMQTIGAPFSLWDRIQHMIMPSSILAVFYAGMWARYTRASVLEVMHADFVTVARSKGLRERVVIFRHVFRNAMLPLVTVVALSLPQLLGGAIIIETIFQWPGMGMLGYRATVTRDYPILMGVLLISAIAILISNIVADVAYALVDPRIRYD